VQTLPPAEPGEPQYFAVDFARFLSNGTPPRGLFQLRISGWDPVAKKRIVGQSEPGGSLFWRARPGHFVLRAIDELGRSHTQPLEVTLVSDGRAPRP